MVDVQAGILHEPRVDEIDQVLERPTLAVAIVRPERLVARLGSVEQEHAEEILEAARGLEEGMALQIEDDVARRPRREPREATADLDVERPPFQRAGLLPDELEPGLLA